MANRAGDSFIEPAFPPGTDGVFVEQGTLLGYAGDYNGQSLRDIWVHLHFSIVLDNGRGRYANELEFANTLDPSPYLGLPVNYACRSEAMTFSDPIWIVPQTNAAGTIMQPHPIAALCPKLACIKMPVRQTDRTGVKVMERNRWLSSAYIFQSTHVRT